MYKVVIGLEVHCELKSNSKNFSSARNSYNNEPNVNVLPVDLGLPGILPVINKEGVRKAIKTAMALNCQIPDEVIFDRKNYYYPDLPKGYQITQMTKPFGRNGSLTFFVNNEEKTVLIHQLHLEEDTASLDHLSNYSLIDYNRCGVPLMEIVSEPCIYSADEAVAYLESLRNIFLYTEVSDARSDKGQMRCDVNISLMKEDDTELGTKVEIKNINSFAMVKAAIEYEIKRQTEILNNNGKIIQETRRINEEGTTFSMREKVDAVDYKYFVDPNLPPIRITEEFKKSIKEEIPELQYEKIKRYLTLGLTLKESSTIARDKDISNYFDNLYKLVEDKTTTKNWIATFVISELNRLEITAKEYNITEEMLANIINLVNRKELNQLNAKEILKEARDLNKNPFDIIQEKGIKKVDDSALVDLIKSLLDKNPSQVKDYLGGRDFLANFFVGQVMKETNKQANPEVALNIIKEELEKRR